MLNELGNAASTNALANPKRVKSDQPSCSMVQGFRVRSQASASSIRLLISGTALAASGTFTVTRTISEPARARSMH